MKKLPFMLFFIALYFCYNSLFAQAIQIDCTNERVGIGQSPTYSRLTVSGAISASSLSASPIQCSQIDHGNYGYLALSDNTVLAVNGSYYNSIGLSVSGGSSYTAYFNGNVQIDGNLNVTGTIQGSDKRLKKEISTLNGIDLLKKMERFEGKTFKFKNNDELKTLYQSGEINFLTDTINIISECEAACYRESKKDKTKYEELIQLGTNEYKNEILRLYKNEVLKIYNFNEIIDDTLGVIIRFPNYDDSKSQYGFIAQEVVEEFPELVAFDKTRKIYGVNYVNFVPILFEAIKAQQQQIETLQALVYAQENDIIELKNKDLKSATIDNVEKEKSELFQNTPNPFNQSTTIKYYLENDVTDAFISVCNLNGTQLKSIPIHQSGEGSITIERETLQPGIYLYALVANGQLVDTKKMMITE